MFVALIHIHVKPEFVEPFIAATLENARSSIQEPGIAQFDFVQQADDPTRFALIEAYRSDDARERHRETAHYLKWRDTVADMMAEPRSITRYEYLLRTIPE